MIESIKAIALRMYEADISIFEFGPMLNGAAGSAWEVWEIVRGFFESHNLLLVLAIAILALSLVEAFLGKKIIGFQKFVACFIFGFIIGTAFIYPILAPLTESFAWVTTYVVGAAIGLICALLCLPIYVVFYALSIGYFTYSLMMDGLVPSFADNKIAAAVAMVLVVVLAFICRKVVEIGLTSVLGGVFTYYSVNYLLVVTMGQSMPELLGANAQIAQIGIIAAVSLLGFIVQYKTRRRW